MHGTDLNPPAAKLQLCRRDQGSGGASERARGGLRPAALIGKHHERSPTRKNLHGGLPGHRGSGPIINTHDHPQKTRQKPGKRATHKPPWNQAMDGMLKSGGKDQRIKKVCGMTHGQQGRAFETQFRCVEQTDLAEGESKPQPDGPSAKPVGSWNFRMILHA